MFKSDVKKVQKEVTYVVPTFQYEKRHFDLASKYLRNLGNKEMNRALAFYCREIQGMTLEETGNILGVTRERARQIQARDKDIQFQSMKNYENIELEYMMEHWGESEATDYWVNPGKLEQFKKIKSLYC